ncbi:MAG: hypothetical protein ACLQG3_18945 [Terracidiphilus sp.]
MTKPAVLELELDSLDSSAAAASSGLRTGSKSSVGIGLRAFAASSATPGGKPAVLAFGITGTVLVSSGKGF